MNEELVLISLFGKIADSQKKKKEKCTLQRSLSLKSALKNRNYSQYSYAFDQYLTKILKKVE